MRTFVMLTMLGLAGLACADDTDPEPVGPGSLRQMQGKWHAVRAIINGQERVYTPVRYTIDGDQATYTYNNAGNWKYTLKLDAKRPRVLTMTDQSSSSVRRYYF